MHVRLVLQVFFGQSLHLLGGRACSCVACRNHGPGSVRTPLFAGTTQCMNTWLPLHCAQGIEAACVTSTLSRLLCSLRKAWRVRRGASGAQLPSAPHHIAGYGCSSLHNSMCFFPGKKQTCIAGASPCMPADGVTVPCYGLTRSSLILCFRSVALPDAAPRGRRSIQPAGNLCTMAQASLLTGRCIPTLPCKARSSRPQVHPMTGQGLAGFTPEVAA